jgi:hypothetical protein
MIFPSTFYVQEEVNFKIVSSFYLDELVIIRIFQLGKLEVLSSKREVRLLPS